MSPAEDEQRMRRDLTPERWQEVRRLFHAALEQPDRERLAFLLDACPDDEDLRAQVASLLAAEGEAGSFLESPVPLHLAPGVRLGPYEIESFVGAGGMGEVYRASDPRLGRAVAVKVLTPAQPLDGARLERFEREARAAAALSHPNVLAVFDIGTHDGAPYLVSELLEGESLRAALSHGTPTVARAVEVATQIARGLAAAHDKGIVHRDLKPENLFVTRGGTVKILDFGLAKLAAPIASDRGTALTRTGAVMGTAGYMAPEQVRGQPTDERADVFALGAVLYEILTGRRAFAGESQADILSAVLHEEPPPLETLRSHLPRGLARIVERCLRKDPEERFQSARDLSFALEALGSDGAPAAAGAAPGGLTLGRLGGLRRTSRRAWLASGVLAGGVLATVFAWSSRDAPAAVHPQYRQLTFRRGTVLSARFAPDGHTLVYGAAWDDAPPQVFTGRVESPESRDGGSVDVVDRSGVVSTLSADWSSAQGLAWTPRGDEVWFTASRSGGVRALYAVTLDGRERLVELTPVTLTLHDIAADGRVLLALESLRLGIHCRGPGQNGEHDLSWFDWSLVRDLSEDGTTLLFDESGEGAGPSAAVYLRATDGSPAVRLDEGAAMALSPSGRWVVSIPLEGAPRLVLLPTGAGSPRELRHPGVEAYHWADWFPDGESIFFAASAPGEGVRGFVQALDTETARAITDPGIAVFWNPIAPDGRRLVLAGPEGRLAIYSVDGGTPEPLPDLLPGDRPVRWSSDGEALFLRRGGTLPIQVDRYEPDSGRREPWGTIAPADPVGLVDIPRLVMTGDGRWHAYSYTRLLSELYLVTGLH